MIVHTLVLMLFFSPLALADDVSEVISQTMNPGEDAELLPLIEAGFGVGVSFHADYPGSDHYKTDALPFPYLIYRGAFIYADRRGNTRARFLQNDFYELSLSGAGGFPVKSSDNGARMGMPDLDWMGQIGPRLLIRLMDFGAGRRLRLGLPARAVYTSTDFIHAIHRGWVYEPELNFDYPKFFSENANFFAQLSIAAADENFMEYVYSVPHENATATRAEYDAKKGYFVSHVTVGFSLDLWHGRLRLLPAASVSSLQGAANEGSPLMKSLVNYSVGIVAIPVLYRSEKLAPVDD